MQLFRRPALAQAVIDSMLGGGLSADGANGVFLCGPRRTGKTTFLQVDLIPALEARGVLTLYVDLWAAQDEDAGALIRSAVLAALDAGRGLLGAVADHLPAQVAIAGTGFRKAVPKDRSQEPLPALLKRLQSQAGKRVAVIIDEAQQALKTEAGVAAMFALKSARDTINRPGDPRLLLVMTGSDRDKLLRLVFGNAAPFYGSQVHAMVPLGREFIDFIADQVDTLQGSPVDRTLLLAAFVDLGHRPEFLVQAIGQALNPLTRQGGTLEEGIRAFAEAQRAVDKAAIVARYQSFTPVEQAVLARLLATQEKFQPYDSASIAFYSAQLGRTVTPAMVQKAVNNLRSKEPPVLWRSQRGDYALEDATMQSWYENLVAEGRWPPAG